MSKYTATIYITTKHVVTYNHPDPEVAKERMVNIAASHVMDNNIIESIKIESFNLEKEKSLTAVME